MTETDSIKFPRSCKFCQLFRCYTILIAALLPACGGWVSTYPNSTKPHSMDSMRSASSLHEIHAASSSSSDTINVVRTGRYQLVELAPTAGERDLLQQIVTIDLPQSVALSVREGIEHALMGTGFSLCSAKVQTFLSLPLPAVHYDLGPVTLRTALEVLAGQAWQLHVDYAKRIVCYDPRPAEAVSPTYPLRQGD